MLAPDRHLPQMPLTEMENTTFSSLLIPGVLLSLFLGIYPIVVTFSLWNPPGWRWSQLLKPFNQTHGNWGGSVAVGLIALVWCLVQIQWISLGFLHAFIFGWGILILMRTPLPGVRQYCGRAF